MSNETNRRYKTPQWEIRDKFPGSVAPCEIRPWAFSSKSGWLVDLQCKYARKHDGNNTGITLGWSRMAGDKPLNPHDFITLSWEQAQRVVALSREKDLPLNKCVAAVIDLDAYSKNQLAELAQSPAVWAVKKDAPGTVKRTAEFDATTEAFLAEAKAATAPPKKPAAAAPTPARATA